MRKPATRRRERPARSSPCLPEEGKVIVGGIAQVSKHVKPKKQGDQGGIVTTEGAIYASKVQLYCPNCKQGVRVGYKVEDGKKIRVCKKCGKEI